MTPDASTPIPAMPLPPTQHILLVDDNPTNLKVLSSALQGQGWKTLVATDGESAMVQAEYAQPHLILLDVMMPGWDGFETCQRIKANPATANIPIIFMTALSDAADRVRGLELGAVDYITKPFEQAEVLARVRLHLQLHQMTQMLAQQVVERSDQLSQSLQQLNQAQLQLVQSEKMSTLGQLVAGIGHEINNPIGFVAGNIEHIGQYTQDLLKLVDLYQAQPPASPEAIQACIRSIDLDYLRQDLPKLLHSMDEGMQRLHEISLSLRTFARADRQTKIDFQIHDGIESSLLLLRHRTKATKHQPEVTILKHYGELPLLRCYPGQISQVLMNVFANCLDAFEELNLVQPPDPANPNCITITTRVDRLENQIIIQIRDNGPGIDDSVRSRIFDQNFTTKPVGKGTGLGLPICRQIVEEKHQGTIECSSQPGQGAEFTIKLPL